MSALKTSFESIQKDFKKGADLLRVAAAVHTMIHSILPFKDENGSTARLVMNAVLIQSGYQPVIFFDREEYLKAVRGADEGKDSFYDYLKQALKEMDDICPSVKEAEQKQEHKEKTSSSSSSASSSASSVACRCASCGKEGDLKRCSRCKVVSYCSSTCQKNDWVKHKNKCKQEKS
jgi:hypothetical protein